MIKQFSIFRILGFFVFSGTLCAMHNQDFQHYDKNAMLGLRGGAGFLEILSLVDSDPAQFFKFENLNVVDKHGNTALHIAATRGFLDTVVVLIKKMSPELRLMRNKSGATAQDCARNSGNLRILYLLIQAEEE